MLHLLRTGPSWPRLFAFGVAVCLGPAACRTPPYQPEVVPLSSDPRAFAQLAAIVRARFPHLVECDADRRRLQSDWIDATDGAVPARRRVTVFPTGVGAVGIVVEVSFLHQHYDGTPYWSPPVGDFDRERELGDAVRAASAVSRSP